MVAMSGGEQYQVVGLPYIVNVWEDLHLICELPALAMGITLDTFPQHQLQLGYRPAI